MTNRVQDGSVFAWEDTIVLPTYPPPAPDPNPMFLEKRVNQGSSGRIYPNPFTDRLSGEKIDQAYRAVFLENEYIQVMILPELGGRIFAGLDKTNGYDFFYRQRVIKPALIGLFGPWISGGVEFNWPQHHRPSTFMPVDYTTEEHADGSRTVWLSEHEPMGRTKGMVGVCLYPGKALVETKVRLYNRTPYVQTFLWWENVAVHTNEQYQVFFPPDVTGVTYHARQFMASFPIARGSYSHLDFDGGVDVTWYKNIPQPTSFFALASRYDFFGGYDHGREAGVVNVADHHISPGKKFFTWGNGPFGLAWQHNLSDADDPYLELMAGVYTDNQPDFSWLQPYETKAFSQYWYPIQKIGPSKNANRHVAVNLTVNARQASVGVCATETFRQASLSLTAGTRVLCEQKVDLVPGVPFVEEVYLPAGIAETDLLLRVQAADGRELIRYAPEKPVARPLPDPAGEPPAPQACETAEELYLTGLHLEQYRHATWSPEPYWQEALQRDPSDARSSNALGAACLRRGEFARAEGHFRRAIQTLTRWNPNPYDGEPYYNLGLALKFQHRLDEAYAAFYKATWNYAWQAAGYYALAEIDCRRGDFTAALEHLERSLLTDALNLKARDLKAAVLRLLGRYEEAGACARATIALDLLDFWARNEMVLLCWATGDVAGAERWLQELADLMRGEVQTYLDVAFDYASAGLWNAAGELLARLVHPASEAATVHPMVLYALGYFAHQQGDGERAQELYRRAAQMPPDYCFPARLEEMEVLLHAHAVNPGDARACYYLGNLLYDKRRYEEAIHNWEISYRLEPHFSVPWRNLGLACYNVRRDPEQARFCYLKAFEANPRDPRLLYELDQLLKRLKVPPAERLARMEQHRDLVEQRDSLYVERVALYNLLGQPDEALSLLLSRRFHPWEGGEGMVSGQYATAHLLMGRAALEAGQAAEALAHFEAAQEYPENLGEGKSWVTPEACLQYFAGLASEAVGDHARARAYFRQAAEARAGFSSETYYQALALRKLGAQAAARDKLQALLDFAVREMEMGGKLGYFGPYVANFLLFEDDLCELNRIHCTYLSGLAHLGLGQVAQARRAFEEVLALDVNYLEAQEELHRL